MSSTGQDSGRLGPANAQTHPRPARQLDRTIRRRDRGPRRTDVRALRPGKRRSARGHSDVPVSGVQEPGSRSAQSLVLQGPCAQRSSARAETDPRRAGEGEPGRGAPGPRQTTRRPPSGHALPGGRLQEHVAGDRLRIETRVTTMKAANSLRKPEIYRASELVCRASTDWVYVDLARGRPARIPDDMRSAFPLEP